MIFTVKKNKIQVHKEQNKREWRRKWNSSYKTDPRGNAGVSERLQFSLDVITEHEGTVMDIRK